MCLHTPSDNASSECCRRYRTPAYVSQRWLGHSTCHKPELAWQASASVLFQNRFNKVKECEASFEGTSRTRVGPTAWPDQFLPPLYFIGTMAVKVTFYGKGGWGTPRVITGAVMDGSTGRREDDRSGYRWSELASGKYHGGYTIRILIPVKKGHHWIMCCGRCPVVGRVRLMATRNVWIPKIISNGCLMQGDHSYG